VILGTGLIQSHGTDYYVSVQGNDTNPGTTAQPFRTITRAYSLATAGTTIIVKPGVYTDYTSGWGLRLGKSGTAANPITLRSQIRGQAVIDGGNLSNRNKAIYLDGSYNIIDGFEIRGGPKGGITIWGNYNQICHNDIHHNGNAAITSTYGQDGVYSDRSTRDNKYIGNLIRDNGRTGSNLDHALYLCGDNELVINNVMIRNAAYGLHLAGYTTVSNLKAYNNIIAYNGKSGIILWMAFSGVDIKNNIIFQNGRYGIDSNDAHGSGVVVDRNLVYGNGSGNYNFTRDGSDYTYTLGTTIASAPLFVNSTSAGFDAHLSAGSPAINGALNLSSIFTTDLDGVIRPASGAWDLGAYKYGVTDTTAPAVSLTAPANNATISGLSVAVAANASDNIGVAGVQFKLNGANLGAEDTSSPYSVTLNTTTMLNGTHTLTAVARDAAGNQTTSSVISVLVNNIVNTAPAISSIASQTITAGSSTGPLSFTVSDLESSAGSLAVSGSSSNPTLVPGSGIVFGGSGSGRTITVTPAAGQTGTATITVTVSDGSLTRSTSFSLTVNPLPTIALTAPSSGTSYTAPTTINLAASVTANGNPISKVQFYQGGTLLGEDTSAPYTCTWNNVAAGGYTLTARAVYGAGSTVTSPAVSVSVVSPPPTIALTTPVSGASYTAPATIDLAASVAANGNPISKVQFLQGATLLGEDTSAPYNLAWSSVAAGSYNVSARAVYGTGSTVASTAAAVSVAAAPPSSSLTLDSSSGSLSAPFVAGNGTISQPAYTSTPSAGGRAAYTFNISTAGDYVISAMVDAPNDAANSFFVNIDAEPTDPVMIWDIPLTSGMAARTVSWRGNGTPTVNQFAPKVFTLSAGTHQLIVRGREGNCALGTITIERYGTAEPPVVTLTAPVDGASYLAPSTIDLSASVNSNGHTISKVRFFQGSTLLGEDLTAPYIYSWNAVPAGSYALRAVAVYDTNSEVSSPVVGVAVTAAPTPAEQTFAATSGAIASPFAISSGAISQPGYTALPSAGGRAAYTFTIATAGNYTVATRVNAPDEGANSFFVNIDAEPVDPTMVWDVPVTSGFAERTVAWRGNGTTTSSEFSPKIFTLSAGIHQLIIRGREGNCQLESITVAPVPGVQLASISSPVSPTMRITIGDGLTRVSWPAEAGNYALQSRGEYSPVSVWTDVADVPETVGSERVVTMPFSRDNSLFRLRAR